MAVMRSGLIRFVFLCALVAAPRLALAENAVLYLRPASGAFTTGSTVEVGIYLNTGGSNVNAMKVDLSFPPDKLQVVSPTIGKSLVSFWVVTPTFSNSEGTVLLQGGVPPPGINTSDGLISSVVFRVVSAGRAAVVIRDSSRVFLADGKGTNILGSRSDAIFTLKLPPPHGPTVVAPQHPDPNRWYPEDDVEFVWDLPPGAESVSYVLSAEALAVPDDISEGSRTSVLYRNLPSGVHYFHIKAFNPEGGWGGVSHFAVNIDDEPPADFPIEVSPRPNTTIRRPTLIFETTDQHSGLSHFSLKVIKISNPEGHAVSETPFFIEVGSPFVLPQLDFGTYDAVIRAYDAAGNFREVHRKLRITQAIFRALGPDGVNIRSNVTLPWGAVYTVMGLLASALLYAAHFAYRRHREVERKLALGVLNLLEHQVSNRLRTLRQKREEFENQKLESRK